MGTECIFYKNLKFLRKSKKITQNQMADMLKIKRSTYARMEKYGKTININHHFAQTVYDLFGYTPEQLLTIELYLEPVKEEIKYEEIICELNSIANSIKNITQILNNQ